MVSSMAVRAQHKWSPLFCNPASKINAKTNPPVYCIHLHASLLCVHIPTLFREQILLGIGMMRRLCANAKPIFHLINSGECPHSSAASALSHGPSSEPGCLSDTYGLLSNPPGVSGQDLIHRRRMESLPP